jgi:hypothetical protein
MSSTRQLAASARLLARTVMLWCRAPSGQAVNYPVAHGPSRNRDHRDLYDDCRTGLNPIHPVRASASILKLFEDFGTIWTLRALNLIWRHGKFGSALVEQVFDEVKKSAPVPAVSPLMTINGDFPWNYF